MLHSVVYARLFHFQTKALFTWSLSLALWKLSIYTKSKTLLLMCWHTLHQKCTGWKTTWLWLKTLLRLSRVPTESRKQGRNILLTLTLPCWLEFLPQKPGLCSCSRFQPLLLLAQRCLKIISLFSSLKHDAWFASSYSLCNISLSKP